MRETSQIASPTLYELIVKSQKEGLINDELERALRLIQNPEFRTEVCKVCHLRQEIKREYGPLKSAIYDSPACAEHTLRALYQ